MSKKTGRRIPIADAKAIGNKHGYSQVIIVAWDNKTGTTSVCTWGENQEQCEQAAEGGNFVKKALGWDEKLCNTKPAGQIKRENLKKENEELKKRILELEQKLPND